MPGKQKTKTWNIALIGAGGMGRRWARVLLRIPHARLAIVCDKDASLAKRATEGHRGCRIESDWRVCAKDPNIDIAVIVLPHYLIASASADFVKQGIHVLCEKPGGVSSAEIKRVMALAKTHKAQYMVGFNHRFHDAYVKMQTLFKKGTIGKPLFVRARYGFSGRPGYETEWRLDPARSGGGHLMDQGVHLIDLSRYFLGDVVRAKGELSHLFWKAKGEDNAFALLAHRNGAVSTLHASLTNWKPEHVFELYGTKGYLIVEGLGKRYGGSEILKVGIRDPKFKNPPRERTIICNTDADRSLIREFGVFTDAITGHRDPDPSGNDAIAALQVVEQIYQKKSKSS